MALLARLFVVLAALSLLIGIVLKLSQTVFSYGLAPGSFLRFSDNSLLFSIALMLLAMAGEKAKAR
jgi:hypothetical protein